MWFVLGSYEIQFSNTAAKLTNLVVGNGWNVRSYDDQGIPYSYLARLKKKVISPYYVVHAGLIYSQSIAPPVDMIGFGKRIYLLVIGAKTHPSLRVRKIISLILWSG
jgi:hypothetical protein